MAMGDWNGRIEALRHACSEHHATFPPFRQEERDGPAFEVGPPSILAEIESVESALGMSVPGSLRKVFTEYSCAMDIAWQLPDGNEPPKPFDDIFNGKLHLNLKRLPDLQKDYENWIKVCFSDPEDPYDCVWHGKFPFLDVPNGDIVAIDISTQEVQPVVYLSHDDGEGHGFQLGSSAEDFIDRFLLIGCAGLEDWQWLPFVEGPESGIDPDCENAVQWRKWFRFKPPAA